MWRGFYPLYTHGRCDELYITRAIAKNKLGLPKQLRWLFAGQMKLIHTLRGIGYTCLEAHRFQCACVA